MNSGLSLSRDADTVAGYPGAHVVDDQDLLQGYAAGLLLAALLAVAASASAKTCCDIQSAAGDRAALVVENLVFRKIEEPECKADPHLNNFINDKRNFIS